MGQFRRISKKRHRAHLVDVLFAVSTSYVWRARLVEAGMGRELVVDAATLGDVPAELRRAARRWRLRYVAAWIPHEWTRGWRGYEDMYMFRVRAAEFPEVADYSANNPGTIYARPHLLADR